MSRDPSQNLSRKRLDNLFADLEQEQEKLAGSRGEVSPIGWTWECDQGYHYVSCSDEVEDILGIHPRELIGKSITRFPLTHDSSLRLADALSNRDGSVEILLEYLSTSGVKLAASVHLSPIQPHNGSKTGWRGYAVISPDSRERELELGSPRTEMDSPPPPGQGQSASYQPQTLSDLDEVSGYLADEISILKTKSPLTQAGESARVNPSSRTLTMIQR